MIKNLAYSAITVVACFGLVTLGSLAGPNMVATVERTQITNLRVSVVQIRTTTSSGSGWLASSNGVIVTCAHVVGQDKTVNVDMYDANGVKTIVQGQVIYTRPASDIAIIKVKAKTPVFLTIDPVRPAIGTRILCYGYPFGYLMLLSDGVISGYNNRDKVRPELVDMNIYAGHSGSPIVDTNNNVVGMASAVLSAGDERIGMAVDTAAILDCLKVMGLTND